MNDHNITYKIGTDDLNYDQMMQRLIEDEFHNGRTLEQYRLSFENTAVVCVAYAGDGGIVGTVRALSDGVCNAYIVDVWTYTPYRRRGIARQMMERTFQQLPGQHIFLWTDDMMDFYDTFMTRDNNAIGYSSVQGQWLQNDSPE